MVLFPSLAKMFNKTEVVQTTNFGLHLMIDGYGGSTEKLNDGDLLYRCLDELPELIGMEKMCQPTVLLAPPISEKDTGGYSGFVMISTSHISCHTFPNRGFVSIDLYTCQDQVDRAAVEAYFTRAFSLQSLEVNFVKRGTRYPTRDIC